MIYIKNTSEAQGLLIPRNGETVTGEMTLLLRNTTDMQGISIPVMDLNMFSLYYNLAITLPEGIATGEYHYQLMSDGSLVSCGLLFIGDMKNPYQQRNNQITYKQYESE